VTPLNILSDDCGPKVRKKLQSAAASGNGLKLAKSHCDVPVASLRLCQNDFE